MNIKLKTKQKIEYNVSQIYLGFLIFIYKDKIMSKEMREQINKVKNFGQFINENFQTTLPEREMKYFSWILEPDFKTYKQMKYDEKMERLRKDEEKYNLIFDILDYMDIYNKKVGINKRISITNLDAIINKNLYNLKEIKHKWMKLSENPDIEPKDIFIDFNVGG